MKSSIKANQVLLYITIATTLLLVGNRADGLLAYGVYIGAVYSGNVWIVSLLYLASSCLYGFPNIVQCAVRVAVMVSVMLIHRWLHKQIGKKLLIVYVLLGNIFYLVYGYSDIGAFMDKVVNVLLGTALAFVSIYTFRCVFVRGIRYRPSMDETICIALFWLICCFCMAKTDIWIYNISMFVIPIVVLLSLFCLGDLASTLTAFVSGLAVAIATGQMQFVVLYMSIAVMALLTNRANRYLASLSIVAVDIALAYFLDIYTTFDIYVLLPMAIACIITMIIPSKAISSIKDLLGTRDSYAGTSIINRLRTNMSQRLYQLSVVFLSMKNIFKSMATSTIGKNEAKIALVKNISEHVCIDCSNRQDCWRNNIRSTEQSMLMLAECGIERGKATILDISPSITTSCKRLSTLLSYINSQCEQYSNYIQTKTSINNSRLLIGEQLGGVSQLMNKMSQDLRGKLIFDSGKEQEIVAQLTFHNILTSEAFFLDAGGTISIILTVATKDIDNQAICNIVGKIVSQKLLVEKTEPTSSSSWSTMYLAVMPQYSISYGIRTACKQGSEVSGDTHSFVKIGGNKCMISVCDGMGSGGEAELVSSTAISLVENFYKAGFDNDIVLSCVNRLMAGYNSEVFTAVDICVVDLSSGLADFIKLGASVGLVRNNGEVNIIVGNSLPLGAVATPIQPSITKKALVAGDIIVIASDGLWDTVADKNIVGDIVNNTLATNPQIIADNIMDKALSMCNNRPIDDITVIVARVV